MRSAGIALLAVLLAAPIATAQPSNLTLYQALAVDCLGDLPSEVDSVVLDAPAEMSYVRSALVERWTDDGLAVFLADSTRHIPHLEYVVEESGVAYARSGPNLAREVRLALRYTLTNGEGRILLDDGCSGTRSDNIPPDALSRVEHEAYPETRGERPIAGWFRRFVEPAVLTAATAIAVYLFFTLRSTNADGS